jgi:hypothetical protein
MRLYRRVLRLHRQKLPAVQRSVGDEYCKKEFRAHRELAEESHFHQPFFRSWNDYCQQLDVFQPLEGAKGWSKDIVREQAMLGRDLTQSELDTMSDEQKAQLFKLKESTIEARDKLFNES